MGFLELLIIAVGLAMDAFAVSVCKGLAVGRVRASHALKVGVWFGGFQALMPLVGYALGVSFAQVVEQFDHWIAFVLLSIIGINMIREAREGDSCGSNSDFSWRIMLAMAVATSIDALAVGVSFAFLRVDVVWAVVTIGVITFLLSIVGLLLGNRFGCRFKSKAEIIGGAILVAMGVKILIEHLSEAA
ncbi:MAG: manganese efflux pump [Rikenellaceae bacterium]|nr:manganese efflux pump [Rikenellaceae bacterium]